MTYLLGGPSSCSNYEKWTCVRLDVVGTWRVSDEFRRIFSSLAHANAQMHAIWNTAKATLHQCCQFVPDFPPNLATLVLATGVQPHPVPQSNQFESGQVRLAWVHARTHARTPQLFSIMHPQLLFPHGYPWVENHFLHIKHNVSGRGRNPGGCYQVAITIIYQNLSATFAHYLCNLLLRRANVCFAITLSWNNVER